MKNVLARFPIFVATASILPVLVCAQTKRALVQLTDEDKLSLSLEATRLTKIIAGIEISPETWSIAYNRSKTLIGAQHSKVYLDFTPDGRFTSYGSLRNLKDRKQMAVMPAKTKEYWFKRAEGLAKTLTPFITYTRTSYRSFGPQKSAAPQGYTNNSNTVSVVLTKGDKYARHSIFSVVFDLETGACVSVLAQSDLPPIQKTPPPNRRGG